MPSNPSAIFFNWISMTRLKVETFYFSCIFAENFWSLKLAVKTYLHEPWIFLIGFRYGFRIEVEGKGKVVCELIISLAINRCIDNLWLKLKNRVKYLDSWAQFFKSARFFLVRRSTEFTSIGSYKVDENVNVIKICYRFIGAIVDGGKESLVR